MKISEAEALLIREARTANRSAHTVRAHQNYVSAIAGYLDAAKGSNGHALPIDQTTVSDLKDAFAFFASEHSPASVVR